MTGTQASSWLSDRGLERMQEALASDRLDQAEDAIRAESSNGFADDLFRSLAADIARVKGEHCHDCR